MAEDIYNIGLHFKAVARAHAALPALRFAGEALDYAALDNLSDRAAAHLLSVGVALGDVVAIYAEKSALTYAALLGALKIGAPYVVLDVESPAARLDKILERCRPTLLLADREFGWRSVPVLPLAALGRPIAPVDMAVIGRVPAEAPAYLMFTSGSTGFPKGAAISHASLLNFCRWAGEAFRITPQDIISGVNALYFDNSVFDFAASLLNGACLLPVGRETVTQAKQLVESTRDCTVWFSVPSLLIYLTTLKALDATSWPNMRAIIFGGEGYPKAELKKLYALFGGRVNLWNVYGPTECTCICSAYAIGGQDFSQMDRLAPLGHLADHFTGAVMDESGTGAVPAGEVGELFLMGQQVALEYYNDAERTHAAFAANPLYPSLPCYRTGDLVWQDVQTGYYHFAGRKDSQVKHMGYRVELEEIEAALGSFPEVAQAAVIYRRRAGHGGAIIAFVATHAPADAEAIKTRLRGLLPSYMIPQEVHVRREFPKNANGKIDRGALAAQDEAVHG